MSAFAPMDSADDADILEPYTVSTALFTGVRMHIVGGVAHLLFFVAQPTADGRVEYVLVARMVAPTADARVALDRAMKAFSLGPVQSSFVPEGQTVN